MLTTKQIELIEKKEFITIAFDLSDDTFIVHVILIASSNPIYPSHQAQITSLKVNKVLTAILSKYANFVDNFSPDLVIELPKYTEIKDYTIELVDNTQPFYNPIYSLGLVKLETLETYIKTNLANNFIKPLKFPISIGIFFT